MTALEDLNADLPAPRLPAPRSGGGVRRRAVTSASGTTDGTLTIDWIGPARLQVHDSEVHYEGYQVSNGDLYIVV